jgi:hypothetical protein
MKQIFFAITGLLIFSNLALADVPKCYNDSGVSPDYPYIVSFSAINPMQGHLINEALTEDSLVNEVDTLIQIDDLLIVSLAIDPTQVVVTDDSADFDRVVDELVYQLVMNVTAKHELDPNTVVVECNGTVTGYPRAGGGN